MCVAEPRRRIAILLEYFADGSILAPNNGVVPWESGGLFGNHAKAHRVMVTAIDQCRSARRAQRSGVKLCVAQPRFRDLVWAKVEPTVRARTEADNTNARIVGVEFMVKLS
jgi:hypothetical protein